MKKHIVCFGDSNTHGYCADPSQCGRFARYDENQRWPRLLEAALGSDYLVLEEGLSGRTTVFDDPLYEGLSGLDYIVPCLKSHEPVSLLIIMLGTNDTKERFGASPECIALGMERLAQTAAAVDCWENCRPNILIIAPPAIGEEMRNSDVAGTMGRGCAEKSRKLAPLYAACAGRLGAGFLNAQGCQFNSIDYMHLTAKGHAQLAGLVADWMRSWSQSAGRA